MWGCGSEVKGFNSDSEADKLVRGVLGKCHCRNGAIQRWVVYMKAIKIICACFLLLGVLTLPYGYYRFLRWVVTLGGIFSAVSSFQKNAVGWAFSFGIIAILFNPIAPFHMEKSTWVVFDILTAIVFGVSAFSTKEDAE
jgi:uncharacterized membrane protein HdeD (DUF308 family)